MSRWTKLFLVAAALTSVETITVLAVALRDQTRYTRWLTSQPPSRMYPPPALAPVPLDLPDQPPADAFALTVFPPPLADPALGVSGG